MERVSSPAFGADIGGTAIKLGCLDSMTELEIPTEPLAGPEALARRLVEAWRKLGAEPNAGSFGLGCAGLIDPTGVVVTSPNLPGWKAVPLARLIEAELGTRPELLNDANACVLAEARLGAGRELGSGATIVGVTIGTGVGGGLVIEGRLHAGRRGFAGEPGHMPIDLDGPLCACGARGCLESLIGTRAVLDRYRALSGDEDSSLMPRDIALRAEAGDVAARETWRQTGEILGRGLVGLAHLLDPDLLIVGGGLARAGELLLAPARIAFARDVLIPESLRPPIVSAELSNSAGWIGAALAGAEA